MGMFKDTVSNAFLAVKKETQIYSAASKEMRIILTIRGVLGALYINMYDACFGDIARFANLFNFMEANIHDIDIDVLSYMDLLICAFSPLPWSFLRQVSPPLKSKHYELTIIRVNNITILFTKKRLGESLAYTVSCNCCKHIVNKISELK